MTEDLDLAIRAHLAGWRAAYLPQVTAAGELPTTLAAWRTQQHRWNKGFAQVARKLLPSVWRSDMPPLFKLALTLEVGQSLFCPLAALCLTTSLSLLWLNAGQQPLALSLLGLVATAMGVFSATTFVTLGQLALGRYPRSAIPLSILAAMTLTSGLILSNSRAVFEAAMGKQSPFVRTPKMGGTGIAPAVRRHASRRPARPAFRKSCWDRACSSRWSCAKAGIPPARHHDHRLGRGRDRIAAGALAGDADGSAG